MKKDLYDKTYFRRSKKFQVMTSRYSHFRDEILKFHPRRVLDVGCGLGTLVAYLRAAGVDAVGVDFAQTLKKDYLVENMTVIDSATKLPFGDGVFDIVVSTDFFEHLDEDEVDIVYSEMKRVGKKVLASIAYEAPLTARQALYHSTNKPRSWWEEKLKGITLI